MGKNYRTIHVFAIMALFFPLFGIGAAVLSQTTKTQPIITWELLLFGSIAATLVLGIFYIGQHGGETRNKTGEGSFSNSTNTGSKFGRWILPITAMVILSKLRAVSCAEGGQDLLFICLKVFI